MEWRLVLPVQGAGRQQGHYFDLSVARDVIYERRASEYPRADAIKRRICSRYQIIEPQRGDFVGRTLKPRTF